MDFTAMAEGRGTIRCVSVVEQIIAQKKRLQAEGLSQQERTQLERQVEAYEEQIDDLVCRLYGVDALPA